MKIAFLSDQNELMGLQYISALLKTNGHEVKLFIDPRLFNNIFYSVKFINKIFDYKDKIISDLKDFDPDLIGFDVFTDIFPWACEMSNLIKKELKVPIIFGQLQ